MSHHNQGYNHGHNELTHGDHDSHGEEGAIDSMITADEIDPDFFLHEVSDAAKDKNAGAITEDQYDNLIEFMVHIRVALDQVDLSHDGTLEHATQMFTAVVDEIQVPNLGTFDGSTVASAVETLYHNGHCHFLFSLFVVLHQNADISHLPDLQATLTDVVSVLTGGSAHMDTQGFAASQSQPVYRPSSGDGGDAATAAVDLDPATLFPDYCDYSGATGSQHQ